MNMNKQEQINYLIKNNCSIDGFNLDVDFGYDTIDWAKFWLSNPKDAKFIHAYLLNNLYETHFAWQEKILSKSNGVQILSELYSITNPSIINLWKEKAKEIQSNL